MIICIVPRFLKTIAGADVTAMALFPFILVRDTEVKDNEQTIRHERIHFRQQLELVLIFFYLLYGLFFLYYFLVKRFSKFEAYKAIPFEREAYAHDADLEYLRTRSWFGWLSYLNS